MKMWILKVFRFNAPALFGPLCKILHLVKVLRYKKETIDQDWLTSPVVCATLGRVCLFRPVVNFYNKNHSRLGRRICERERRPLAWCGVTHSNLSACNCNRWKKEGPCLTLWLCTHHLRGGEQVWWAFKVCELVEQKDTLCIPALRRRRVTSVMWQSFMSYTCSCTWS